jgi:hypothetical protein
MMEAVRTSETSVDNHFTRQYIPEDNSERNKRINDRNIIKCGMDINEYGGQNCIVWYIRAVHVVEMRVHRAD